MRQCAACDSYTTHLHTNGSPQWRWHYNDWMCQNCYHRYVWNPVHNPITHEIWKSTLSYKYRLISLRENPRKGVCKLCGKKVGDPYINCFGKLAVVKRTNMHHKRYHDDDVLKDTIELCNSCHSKVTQGTIQI